MALPAGRKLTAQLVNDTLGETKSDTQNTAGTTTSTGFTATLTGGTAAGVAFVANKDGEAIIHYNALAQNSAANYCYTTPQVRTGNVVGSGTLVLTASDDDALTQNGTVAARYGGSKHLTGLTPGADYNVQLLHRVTAGTGTFSRKHVIVNPTT